MVAVNEKCRFPGAFSESSPYNAVKSVSGSAIHLPKEFKPWTPSIARFRELVDCFGPKRFLIFRLGA